jgi:V/A-type H+-transporting ATPase subunit D
LKSNGDQDQQKEGIDLSEISGIRPTRMELLRLRRRRMLADDVLEILKRVMATLMITLFEIVQRVPTLRKEMNETLKEAYSLYLEAAMLAGSRKIEEISWVARPVDLDISMKTTRGILGITLPTLELEEKKSDVQGPRYGLSDTPVKLDESGEKLRKSLESIVKLVETQASLKEVLEAMSIKRRQTNRIQHRILPQLDAAMRYIASVLEETERQDTIRIRALQRKRRRSEQGTSY